MSNIMRYNKMNKTIVKYYVNFYYQIQIDQSNILYSNEKQIEILEEQLRKMRDYAIKQDREAERFIRAHELKEEYKDIMYIRHQIYSM